MSIRVPHVFALLTGVVFACSVLTWVVPSGEFAREVRMVGGSERTMVVADTYERVPKHRSARGLVFADPVREDAASPVGLEGFLSAIPRGMIAAGDIIFFIFIIGGVFGILQETGTIPAVLHAVLNRLRHRWRLLTVVLMLLMGIGGSTLGMGEEFIPLVPIFLVVAAEIGCDRVYGTALVYVAGAVGFAAATTNPFTVNIAQSIAGLPLNSAMGFRIVFFACCMTVTVAYMLRYGARVRANPEASVIAGVELDHHHAVEPLPLTKRHVATVVSCVGIFVFILWAVQARGWWLPEMAGGFVLMGLVAIIIARMPVADATRAVVRGMEEMTVAALVVGFARAVTVVMEDGLILDTLIQFASSLLAHVPRLVAAEGMLLFQSLLNFFIPSGSGQAAVTMPLMAPLADVLGLTRQTAVFAFTCGDGFSNMVIPTSGILMASLGLAGVPYERWLRFMVPLLGQLLGVAAIFMAVAVVIGLE